MFGFIGLGDPAGYRCDAQTKSSPLWPRFRTYHGIATSRRFGPRPCENSNARRARRNFLEELRVMRTDAAADIRLDAMSENCIFYISPMYEFSHSLGQSRHYCNCEKLPDLVTRWAKQTRAGDLCVLTPVSQCHKLAVGPARPGAEASPCIP